ncbi:MAG: toxin-antitoxin (TA) system antitoxin [Planctomycetes bacterium]|nr:toxin-antitoxin (TA) system antitoxin [Planctomycetota bacterium]
MQATVDIKELPGRLDALLQEAKKKGTEIILTRDNVPQAQLVPLVPKVTSRVPDLNAGGVLFISEDFDAPLPEEFWSGMP